MDDASEIVKNMDFTGKTILIALQDFSYIQPVVDVLYQTGGGSLQKRPFVISTSSGTEVIRTVCEENIDIIFLSKHLYFKDGIEATRGIRNINNNKSKVPIIACLSDILLDDLSEWKKAGSDQYKIGCNDFLLRPLPIDFLEMAHKYLNNN